MVMGALLVGLCYRHRVSEWMSGWSLWQSRWVPKVAADWVSRLVPAGFSSLDVLKDGGKLLGISGWSVLVWGTAILTNVLVLMALQVPLGSAREIFVAALLVLVGLMLGISIPSIPGRIGLFEYICVLSLVAFGISRPSALAYGILLHAVVLLPSTLAGLIALLGLGLVRPSSRQLTVFEDTLKHG